MQRLFSMFPTGQAGVALLLLRLGLAVLLSHGGGGFLVQFGAPWLSVATLTISAALILGLWTPLTAVLIVISIAGRVVVVGYAEPINVCTFLDVIALALVGPGAYSLDAKFFGRKKVVLTS